MVTLRGAHGKSRRLRDGERIETRAEPAMTSFTTKTQNDTLGDLNAVFPGPQVGGQNPAASYGLNVIPAQLQPGDTIICKTQTIHESSYANNIDDVKAGRHRNQDHAPVPERKRSDKMERSSSPPAVPSTTNEEYTRGGAVRSDHPSNRRNFSNERGFSRKRRDNGDDYRSNQNGKKSSSHKWNDGTTGPHDNNYKKRAPRGKHFVPRRSFPEDNKRQEGVHRNERNGKAKRKGGSSNASKALRDELNNVRAQAAADNDNYNDNQKELERENSEQQREIDEAKELEKIQAESKQIEDSISWIVAQCAATQHDENSLRGHQRRSRQTMTKVLAYPWIFMLATSVATLLFGFVIYLLPWVQILIYCLCLYLLLKIVRMVNDAHNTNAIVVLLNHISIGKQLIILFALAAFTVFLWALRFIWNWDTYDEVLVTMFWGDAIWSVVFLAWYLYLYFFSHVRVLVYSHGNCQFDDAVGYEPRGDDYSLMKSKHSFKPHLVLVKSMNDVRTIAETKMVLCAELCSQIYHLRAIDHKSKPGDVQEKLQRWASTSTTVKIPRMCLLRHPEFNGQNSMTPIDVRLATAYVTNAIYHSRMEIEEYFNSSRYINEIPSNFL